MRKIFWECIGGENIQPIPFEVIFSTAVSKLKAQSSNVSFHWNVAKETCELWALSFRKCHPKWDWLYQRRNQFAARTVRKHWLVPRILPVKWHLTKEKYDRKQFCSRNLLEHVFWCNFSRSLHCAFDRLDATTERIPVIFLRFSGFFLTQMGPKVNFDDFWWNHHKAGILCWFGKRFAVIQEIITFGIDVYRQFPSRDSISGSRCSCKQFRCS